MTNIRIRTCRHFEDDFTFCGRCGLRLTVMRETEYEITKTCGFDICVVIEKCDLENENCDVALEIE